jgi:hypothetical protein
VFGIAARRSLAARSAQDCVCGTPQRVKRCRAAGDLGPIEDYAEDYYDVLEATPADSIDTLRENYRRLQKRAHPDIVGSASVERSAQINVAYTVLSDPAQRATYNAKLSGVRARGARAGGRGRRSGATPTRREGLVGPLRSERLLATLLPRRAPDSDLLSGFELRDSVREFARTMAYAADLPLPLPLQVDDTPSGVRIAMLRTANNGGLASVGELLVDVLESEECDVEVDLNARTCDWRVSVIRRWPDNGSDNDVQLPGEGRILQALKREFRHLLTVSGAEPKRSSGGFTMPGWLSAMGAWALPALPLVPLGQQDSGGLLSGYYLQRSCRLAPVGRRPVSANE